MKSLLLFGLLGAVMTSAQGPGPQPCPTTDYSCKCERLMGLKPPPPPRGSHPPGPQGGGGRPPHRGSGSAGDPRPPPPPGSSRPQSGGSRPGRPDHHKDPELHENIKTQCFNDTEPSVQGQEPVLTDAQKNCIFNLFMTSKGVIVDGVINQEKAIEFMTASVEEKAIQLGLSTAAITAVQDQLSQAVETCYSTYSTQEQIPDFRTCVKDKCQEALEAQA